MKKKTLLIAAIFTAGMTFAQDAMTSKKGTPILPEAGDYAIGFDASNLLNYGGNFLNGTSGNSLNNLGDIRNNTIYGKYFLDANKAYRGMLQLGFGSNTVTTPTPNLGASNINFAGNPTGPGDGSLIDPNSTVENEVSTSNMGIAIGGGIEMRQGKGRLQGVYGPMAMIALSSSSTERTYGNSLTDTYYAEEAVSAGSGTTSRVTETSAGSTFSIMVGGFAGVEYFFAPKISLGAEIQYGINFSSTGASETTTESITTDANIINPQTQTATVTGTETNTAEGGSSSSFNLGQTPNTMITLNFHF